jgi:uncharacterized membrane protein HdeD (DUF308 family)
MNTILSIIITILTCLLITKCSITTMEIVGFLAIVIGIITIIISIIKKVRRDNELYRLL